MSEDNVIKLKKKIVFRCMYTGIKETDFLYKKFIVNNIDILNYKELKNLLTLFQEMSDSDILLILTNKINPNKKYIKLFEKLMK